MVRFTCIGVSRLFRWKSVFDTVGDIKKFKFKIQGVPLATEPGIYLITLPLMSIFLADCCSVSQQLGALQTHTHTTDTFPFISHTTNVLLFKFLCNIFMPGSVASGTSCII